MDNFSLPESLSFLLEELSIAGLPKSIAERSDFLPSLILGTENVDSLTGTEDRDYIFGLAGDDTIAGLGGNDFLFSGEGNNTVRGGDGRDRIYGKSGADLLFGDAGDDRFRDVSGGNEIDGGEGRDTINYRNIDEAISLRVNIEPNLFTDEEDESGLRIEREGVEPDKISNIERIIAPEGQANAIDFQAAFFGPPFSGENRRAPNIKVNLAEGTLTTGAVSGVFDGETTTVDNFVDVTGSLGDDVIVGSEANNNLDGLIGSNRLEGAGGDDFLSTFERDTLIGGSGRDTFSLKAADKRIGSFIGPFPPPVDPLEGSKILDFQTGTDKIQLNREGEGVQFDTGLSFAFDGFEALPIGELDESMFSILGSGEAASSASISYDTSTGDLFYNIGDNSNKVATLQGAPTLSASDIFVV